MAKSLNANTPIMERKAEGYPNGKKILPKTSLLTSYIVQQMISTDWE